MLTRVMCYATTVCSTRVVRVGLCVRSFGRGFLPMYESREVSTVGSALTYKILKINGQVVPRSTIRNLTLDELTKPDHISMIKAFDNNIIQKLGMPATDNNFDKDYFTPTYEYYYDDHQDTTIDAPPEQLTPTS